MSADELQDLANHPLVIFLDGAVAMAILDFESRGGPTDADREWARSQADDVASRSDVMLFGARGQAGNLAGRLARALAICAFQPGGVRLAGRHWEAGLGPAPAQ